MISKMVRRWLGKGHRRAEAAAAWAAADDDFEPGAPPPHEEPVADEPAAEAAGADATAEVEPAPAGDAEEDPAPAPGEPQAPAPAPAVSNARFATPEMAESRSADEHLAASVRSLRERLETSDEELGDAPALVDLIAAGPPAEIRQIPAAAHGIMELTRDLNAPRSKLVALIEGDPSIASAILQQANSAAFNTGGASIASLSLALDRMGMAATRAVVLQQVLSGLISRPGGDLDVMAAMVWRHMTDAAGIARMVGPFFDVDPDAAFATALLHDVGKLVIFDLCSNLRRDRRRALHLRGPLLSEVLGLAHEAVGAVSARAWEMPEDVVQAIGAHHRRSHAGSPEAERLAQVVFLAEKVDLARRRRAEPDLAALWAEGGLEAEMEEVAAVVVVGDPGA
jgi:putative nucleotidyltransferase with HDIG domain